MGNNKKVLFGVIALAVLVLIFAVVWFVAKPTAQQGEKTITVEVVHKDGSTKNFTYQTDAENLGDVLMAEGLIEAENGSFGLYITAVDGEAAIYEVDGGWWCVVHNGVEAVTGVSETLIADGDAFRLVYTIG